MKEINRKRYKRIVQLRDKGRKKFNLRYKTYEDYLNSSEWKEVKRIFLSYRKIKVPCCVYCKSTENIHIHHKSYSRLGCPSELYDLVTLCKGCHFMLHRIQKEFNVTLQNATRLFVNREKNYKKNKKMKSAKKAVEQRLLQIQQDKEVEKRGKLLHRLADKGIFPLDTVSTSTLSKIYSSYS